MLLSKLVKAGVRRINHVGETQLTTSMRKTKLSRLVRKIQTVMLLELTMTSLKTYTVSGTCGNTKTRKKVE